jgi:hypothetical protein
VWVGRVFVFILSLQTTLFNSFIVAQSWSMNCQPDYYIELYNFWNDEEKEIEVVVSLPDYHSTFNARIIIKGDIPNGVHFPFDFAPQAIDSILLDQGTTISITAYSKRNKIAYLETYYDPAENLSMQLKLTSLSTKSISLFSIWGNLLDKYTWEDKTGENLLVRSNLTHTLLQKDENLYRHYVYLYHFRKNETTQTWEAVQKYTDVVSQCNLSVFQPFDISFLYLTDVNKDGIGEINYRYKMSCPQNDSILPIVKTVLVTDGKRYSTVVNSNDENNPLQTNFPFKYDPVFERYIKRIGNILP